MKFKFLLFVFIISSLSSKASEASFFPVNNSQAFITIWRTTVINESIIVPVGIGTFNYSVDWGDGTLDTGVSENAMHNYAIPGNHTISITGIFPSMNCLKLGSENANSKKLISVEQWGTQVWEDMTGMFADCTNLITVPTSVAPNLSNVTSTNVMFSGASSFNGDLSAWNVSGITNMSLMFSFANLFNGDLSSWNVAAVTDMSGMFYGAKSFNKNLSSWNVSNVKEMNAMFCGAISFNGDVSSWNVLSAIRMKGMFEGANSFNGDISTWNVSEVEELNGMFLEAKSFNGNLSSWNISQVTDMSAMFYNADLFVGENISGWSTVSVVDMSRVFEGASSFIGDISSWNVSNVKQMEFLFKDVSISSFNYDKLLTSWSGLNLQSGVTLSGIEASYCSQSSIDVLKETFNWTILDGGLGDSCTAAVLPDDVFNNKKLFFYPNPANDKVFINATEQVKYELKSLQGILLSKGSIGFKEPIDISNLETGIYLLIIHSEGTKRFGKLMKI